MISSEKSLTGSNNLQVLQFSDSFLVN